MNTQCAILNCAEKAEYHIDVMVCSDMYSLAGWDLCSVHSDDVQLYQNEMN